MKYIIIVLLLTIGLLIYEIQTLKVNDKESDLKELQELYVWKSKRLTNYTLIVFEQSKIIDRFKSSREAKDKNKELTRLFVNLEYQANVWCVE